MTSQKCRYYDKGYFKLKENCQDLHPSTDCVGECVNIITCPFRHRVLCKNGNACFFTPSTACEFLHTEEVIYDNNKIVLVEKQLSSVHAQITSLDNKILVLEEQKDLVGFQSFSGFGIFFWHLGILTILAFLASLTFWHYEIQKKTA